MQRHQKQRNNLVHSCKEKRQPVSLIQVEGYPTMDLYSVVYIMRFDFRNSYYPLTTMAWNNLPSYLREADSLAAWKGGR